MYPVMLDIRDRPCLVVGGGGVAVRKVQGLLEEGARVTVVALEAAASLRALADAGVLELDLRAYRAADVEGRALVLAATDDPEVNRQVATDAAQAGIWVNAADDAAGSTFHLPARIRRGAFQLAIASAGEAPFAIRRLRETFERRLGQEWGEWLEAAGRYRRQVLDLNEPRELREERYDRFFDATVDRDRLRARVPNERERAGWLGREVAGEEARAAAVVPPRREAAGGPGMVSLVGAGPGCPGLMTVRGRARLLSADAVVYDRLAEAALPTDLPASVQLHPVGKTAGSHPVPQEEINALLVRLARTGLRVVRLKGGDPYVFGRGGEEAEVLAAEGIPFEVVPGVTSGVAAMAWAGIPVTHRRESVRLTLLTAHEAVKHDGPQVRWDLLAQDRNATIVGYMGVTALGQVVHELLSWGMPPDVPAAMVERGTTAGQRVVVSTVEELPAAVVEAGLGPPALFVIGPTVRHAPVLDWFGRSPLACERIAVGADAAVLRERLEAAGAEVVPVPFPLTPAARVVLHAAALTGCVVLGADEVDLLDEERGGPGWGAEVTAWCSGEAAWRRAVERGWRRPVALGDGLDPAGIAGDIVARRRRV